jgi:hypothetical protein
MSGKFRDGQKKIACISDYGAGNHYYITVTKANGDGTADAKYLDWGIQREMGGCERGGHSWDGDWEFK